MNYKYQSFETKNVSQLLPLSTSVTGMFLGRLENPMKILRIHGVRVEIRTKRLWNANLEHYRYVSLLGDYVDGSGRFLRNVGTVYRTIRRHAPEDSHSDSELNVHQELN